MQKQIDIDKAILFLLPLVFIATLIISNEQVMLFSSGLVFVIFLYEIIVFNKREIYGFSGIKIIAIPSLVFTTFTIFIAIPSVYISTIKYSPAVYPYYFSIMLFYILFPMGLYFGDMLRKIDIRKINGLSGSKFSKDKIDFIFYELLIILLSICILIFFDYVLQVKEIPIVEILKSPGQYTKFSLMREEALKILPVTFIEKYLFHWLRSLFIPLGIIGSLFFTIAYKKKKYSRLFLLFLIFGLFVNSMTLEKSPLAAIFLSIMSLFFLKKSKISVPFLTIAILLIFAGPIALLYLLQYGQKNVLTIIFNTLIYRIFIVPSEVLYYYFEYFPNLHDFLLGRSTQLFAWLSDEGTFPLANYVAKVWWNDPGTTGSANANYLGNFWADFGWIGIIISTFFVGFIIHLFYWKVLTISNYKMNFIFVVVTCVVTPTFTFGFFSSNFTTLFFTKGLLFIILFLLGIKVLENKIYNLSSSNDR